MKMGEFPVVSGRYRHGRFDATVSKLAIRNQCRRAAELGSATSGGRSSPETSMVLAQLSLRGRTGYCKRT